MGCHTWFYRKFDVSIEQVKEDAIYICQQQILRQQKYIDDPYLDIEWRHEYVEDYKKRYNCDPFEHDKKFFEKCLRFIEKGYFKKLDTLSRFYDFITLEDEKNGKFIKGIYNYCARNNSVYIKDKGSDLPNTIFRVGNYPEDQLLSYEETINFINSHVVSFSYEKEMALDKLKQFWEKYPDGMICFG